MPFRFLNATLCTGVVVLMGCPAPVMCGSGTHLEGSLCVVDLTDSGVVHQQTDGGQNVIDAGRMGVDAGTDAGNSLVDDQHLATDWTSTRGTPLNTLSVALDASVPPTYGGLYFLNSSTSVLGIGNCGNVGVRCDLHWLDTSGTTTHSEERVIIGQSRLESDEVLFLGRQAQNYSCTPGGVSLGTASSMHLDTGAIIHDFAQYSNGVSAQRALGIVNVLGYPTPPTSGSCTNFNPAKRYAINAPYGEIITADDELAASPDRFVLTTPVLENPRRMQVVERDRDAPTSDRVLLTVTDPGQFSDFIIAGQDSNTVVAYHRPEDRDAGTIFTIDRQRAAVVHEVAPPNWLSFFSLSREGYSLRWFWFCSQPLGATNRTCIVKDGRGEHADRTLVLRDYTWVRDNLYLLYAQTTGEASLVDLATDQTTPLPFNIDDGHLRIVDTAGVHDFGEGATVLGLSGFTAHGQEKTRLIFRTVGSVKSFELWHAPSGRHMRVTNRYFTTSSATFCSPSLISGVGLSHPGLYSFVEPSVAGDGTGELFVGAADLLTPPRSMGTVNLQQCRKPKAAIDGLTIGFVQADDANSTVKLTRASLQ